jgi:uncharacterized membrane protein YecN with MAPEG domain
MTQMFPYATAVYAAVLGLLGAILTINVIVNRARHNVLQGDGGLPALTQAIRAHCNFAEQVPMALILVGLVEAFAYRSMIVHGLGVVLLIGRLLSAWGLATTMTLSFGRQAGATLTIIVVAVASGLILYAGCGMFVR